MGDAQFNGTPEEWDALVKKNKKKQTAVEWLVENVIISAPLNWDTTIVKQALEMEKEQHKETFRESRKAYIFEKDMPPVWESFEQYYKETFKSEENETE